MLTTEERRVRRRRRGRPSNSEIEEIQTKLMATSKASGPLRSRLFWAPEMDEVFLALLVEHASNREGSTFKRDAWQDMLVRFNEKTNKNIDTDQLKNRLRFYRHEYRVVMTLRDLPEFNWDEKKQLVVADEACWSKSIAKNKAAKFYKQKPVTCFRELEIIFGSLKDNGNRSCSGQDADALEEDTIEGMDGFEATEVSNLNIVSKDENNDPSDPSTTPNTTNLLSTQAPQQPNIINHCKRQRSYSSMPPTSNRHPDISDRKAAPLPASLASDTFKSLDICLSELNMMEGLDDDLYVKTLIILRDEYNRHVFLRTNGHRRLAWLRFATRDADA